LNYASWLMEGLKRVVGPTRVVGDPLVWAHLAQFLALAYVLQKILHIHVELVIE